MSSFRPVKVDSYPQPQAPTRGMWAPGLDQIVMEEDGLVWLIIFFLHVDGRVCLLFAWGEDSIIMGKKQAGVVSMMLSIMSRWDNLLSKIYVDVTFTYPTCLKTDWREGGGTDKDSSIK